MQSETRWWWIRHAPVPDGGRIYGQRDLDCDCSDAVVFTAIARELPRDAVWITSNLARTKQTAAAILVGHATFTRRTPRDPRARRAELSAIGRDSIAIGSSPAAPTSIRTGSAQQFERAPNGESFHDLFERVSGAINDLSREYAGRDIVAVTHGGTIRAALGHAMGLDSEASLAGGLIDNCSITRIDRATEGWRVVAINQRPWSPNADQQSPALR